MGQANNLQIRIHSEDPRLKRQINHDERSELFTLDTSGLTIADVEWPMHIGTLNQGNTGKCTAEAATEALASDPFWSTLSAAQQATLNDKGSDDFYSAEETLDGDGPYPPQDNGSSGLTSAKVAKARGLISGYSHTFTADDAIKGLQISPASWGTLWKAGMDNVDTTTGQVKYTGASRGGHELCFYKVVVKLEQIWFRQSWGPWGYQNLGIGWISFADFALSLKDQGDVTFFVPLNKPAPVPAPVPPAPIPTPSPAPDAVTAELIAAGDIWEKTIFSRLTKAARLKAALDAYKSAYHYQ